MIRDADRGLKDRFGRAAYVWTGAKGIGADRFDAKIRIDGEEWYRGRLSCVLVGNVGSLFGGISVFADAAPDDGRLDVGIVTADGLLDWARAFGRIVTRHADKSPFVRTTVARKMVVRMKKKIPYELDGGDRSPTKHIKVKIHPGAVSIAVPQDGRR